MLPSWVDGLLVVVWAAAGYIVVDDTVVADDELDFVAADENNFVVDGAVDVSVDFVVVNTTASCYSHHCSH